MSASPELYRALVDDALDLVLVVREDTTIAFVNGAATELLGYRPEEIVDRSVAEFMHEDDLARAVFGFETWSNTDGIPHGTDTYRVRDANGRWRPISMAIGTSIVDGERALVIYGRPADHAKALESMLAGLLKGHDRRETFAPLIDVFDWRSNGTHVAIAWYEPDGTHRFVTSGLPRPLCGAEAKPGAPWDQARRRGVAIHDPDGRGLDFRRMALAQEHGRAGLWIESVPDAATGVPALITVWARVDGMPAEIHAYGMELAKTLVELILRWHDQAARLDSFAHTDELTGLLNRRSLFDLLDRDQRGGALFFCDLDHFKPINDRHGHAVGDQVLQVVAARLRSCVRPGDVVTRTGGDEFVVLAHEVSDRVATQIAERITRAMREPIEVSGTQVELGISVGVARTDGPLSDDDLARADQAMLADKARHHDSPPRARS